ncbi:MAG: hypothetical protein APR63_13930 [Desulfuromonas sp. SDB]|nr:MAG: hypothetical protein APR63_13930 [Desulfuromonas sp. SDB]
MFSCSKEPVQSEQDISQQLEKKAETFIQHMVKGEFQQAAENFDQAMKEAMSVQDLEDLWETMNLQIGLFLEVKEYRYEKYEQFDVIFAICSFEKMDVKFRIVFDSLQQIAGLGFLPVEQEYVYEPPEYVDENLFEEIDIEFGNPDWLLPGNLTLPKAEESCPVVILVHGSGPQDRDETIGPNKLFRDLAWGLSSRGIAVLRYDKRTFVHGQKMVESDVFIDFDMETVDDVAQAVKFLKQYEQADFSKIYVLGHSMGGYLIPYMLDKYPDLIDGAVIMAGNTRPLEDLILEQTEYILTADGELSEFDSTQIDLVTRQVNWAKSDQLTADTPPDSLPMYLPAEYWLMAREYHPAELMKKAAVPVLILQGERDYQVTMEDFQNWKDALEQNDNVSFISYPDLNHLFISGEGESTPEEYMTEGHMSGVVLEDIVKWIDNN